MSPGGGTTPLRIALLAYRGNPHSGGQGVYTHHLSRALRALGHNVEVFAGQPYPRLVAGIPLRMLPSLDLYRSEAPFRRQRPFRDAIDVAEFAIMCCAGYPEPLTFSLRAWRELRRRRHEFDLVHDNQSLGYGLLLLGPSLPVLATIHHPIVVDLRMELAGATWQKRMALNRWYSFIRMQGRVARRLPRLITVSRAARDGIVKDMRVRPERLAVVPNGVDAAAFRPLPQFDRIPGRLVATASADVPLKGLVPLLHALARLRTRRQADLVVIGRPKPQSRVPELIRRLGLEGAVRFVAGVEESKLVEIYAQAQVAVVPSLYEGFSLPAVEAMACAVPVVATTAGALPEVIGRHGETGIFVPPGDPEALAGALERALDDETLRRAIGDGGRARVLEKFTWERAAEATAEQYRLLLAQAC